MATKRLPQVFLSVRGATDDGFAARFFEESRVPWVSVPFGETASEGALQYLVENSTADDVAVLILPVPQKDAVVWPPHRDAANALAAAAPCRRALFLDARDASVEATRSYADTLSSIGEVFPFASEHDLLTRLREISQPYAGTAPPPPSPPSPPPPRVTTAGVGRSGISDVAADVDRLGFEPYVNAVAAFLAHEQTAVPLTMSIEGPWGAGKSSFMRQLEKQLSANFRTIQFNAWRHEKAEELWAAFALHFVEQIKPKKRLQRWRADAALAWRRFDLASGWPDLFRIAFWFLTLAVATITLVTIAVTSGPQELQAIAGEEKSTLSEILGRWFGPALGISGWFVAAATLMTLWKKFFGSVKSPLEIDLRQYLKRPDYEAKLAFIERFQADLRDVTAAYLPGGQRVFVFIDDLDRCELPQAAELMRAINLMLSDSGPTVFIIGMDREKVAAALAVKHEKLLPFLSTDAPRVAADGEVADSLRGIFFGYEFIEKFIQIPFAVPEPSELNVETFLSSLAVPKAAPPRNPEPAATPAAAPAPVAPGSVDVPPQEAAKIIAKLHEFVRPLEDESAHLLEIARRIAPALGNNPRRLKQFVNLFRLRVLIAFATDLFVAPENTPPEQQVTLEKIAKFIAIELRWPLLIAHAEAEPALLQTLEKIANDVDVAESERSFRVQYWSRYTELMTLLRAGLHDSGADADWWIGELDLTRLTNVSVKKPRPAAEEPPASPASAEGTPDAERATTGGEMPAGLPEDLFRTLDEADGLGVRGLHDEAVKLLLPLEKYAAAAPSILLRLGYELLWSDAKRALDYSNRYLAVRPDDVAGQFNAACASAQLGMRGDALRLLRSAIETRPRYALRAYELVDADFRSLSDDPDFISLINRGRERFRMSHGDLTQA